MKVSFEYKLNDVTPDLVNEPVWAPQIKRWSQLDLASFVVAESTYRSLNFLGNPEQLIILSSQGSSATDFLFAHSNKVSPSYFVHTLPNVRSLVFSSLTTWEGPVFCFSQGKHSLVKFLHEIATVHHKTKTLVLNLNKVEQGFQCDFYKIGMSDEDPMAMLMSEKKPEGDFLLDDFSFRQKLKMDSIIQIQNDLSVRKLS